MSSRHLNFFCAFGLSTAIAVLYHQLWAGAQPMGGEGEALGATINVVEALILGMVQGLTEFLPISSTAHLIIASKLLNINSQGGSFTTFSAIIQLGSIGAVLWYFWGDLSQLGRGMAQAIAKKQYDSFEFKLVIGIALGTLPIVAGGLLMKLLIPDLDNTPLRGLTAIAFASITMALLLALAEKLGTHRRPYEALTWRDGILLGCAQALALIPGVSRSGSTLTMGLFANLQREAAARFSFLLGIPAITLAGLVELKEVTISPDYLLPLVVGVISSALFSYLAIAWLIKFLQKRSTWVFVWYRLGFGLLILSAITLTGWGAQNPAG